jgi:L-seryl-tRNA(Ser) seleniumtransferase
VKTAAKSELLRKLPSVDELLRTSAALVESYGHSATADAARTVMQRFRDEISAGALDESAVDLAIAGIAEAVNRELQRTVSFSLRSVINATGVILHTNLGRAPIARSALARIAEVAGVYSNLEFDIATGERGKRDVHADRLFASLLASSKRDVSTIVVNNNAAAVLLALNALAEGGEVIVSRGELVEIGGSFRIPEVMAKSGAVLREVGTTNRTRIADYENAITERTKLLLRVHRSNFEIVGFTEQPSLQALVDLGRKRGIPVMEDLGSGALFDLRSVGVHGETSVVESLEAGVDVVTYSGDKLLGGPQAGLISGEKELVARIRSNPLFRALRVDKLTYAALEATLLAYIKQDYDAIPALRMMRLPIDEIQARANAVLASVAEAQIGLISSVPHPSPSGEGALRTDGGRSEGALQLTLKIVEGESVLGGGSAPGATLPTKLIAVTSDDLSADEIANRLRMSDPPIVTRVDEGRVLLDLRTVLPEQDSAIGNALSKIAGV